MMSKRKFFFRVLIPILIFCNTSFSQKDYKFYKFYTGHLYDFESLSFNGEFEGADIYKLSDNAKYYQVSFLNGKTDWVGVFSVDTFLLEEYFPGGRLVVYTKTSEGILTQNFELSFFEGFVDTIKGTSFLTKLDDKHKEIEVVSYDEKGDVSQVNQKKYIGQSNEISEETITYNNIRLSNQPSRITFFYDAEGELSSKKFYNNLNSLLKQEFWYSGHYGERIYEEWDSIDKVKTKINSNNNYFVYYKSHKGDLRDFSNLKMKDRFDESDIYTLDNNYFKVHYFYDQIVWIGELNIDTFLVKEYFPEGRFTTHSISQEGILSQNSQYNSSNGEIKKGKSYLTKFDDNHNESEIVLYNINGVISNILEKKYDENNQLVQEIYLDKNRSIDTSVNCLCAIKKTEYKDYLKSDEFCYTFDKKLKHKKHFFYDSLGYEIESKETDEVDRILKKTISTYKTVENISDYQTFTTKSLNYREHYFYDNKGNVIEYQKTNSIDKITKKKSYKYDSRGNLIEEIDSTETYYWIDKLDYDKKDRRKKLTKIDNNEVSIYYYSKRNIETKRGKKQLTKKYACYDKSLRPCNCAFTYEGESDNYSIKKSKFNWYRKVKKEIYLDTNNQLTFWTDNFDGIYAPISKYRYFPNGELKSHKTYDKYGKLVSEIIYNKEGKELNRRDNLTFDEDDKTKYSKYKKVQIKDQIWMAENLSVEKFRNGDPIIQAQTNEEWIQAFEKGIPAWCYSYHNGRKIGKLYNIYAVTDTRGLAPKNWHIPSYDEMEILVKNLGGKDSAFKQLIKKDVWNHNEYLKNSYTKKTVSFNALPSGYRDFMGEFNDFNHFAFWGSTISQHENKKYLISFSLHESPEEKGLDIFYHVWDAQGYSVRCIKD